MGHAKRKQTLSAMRKHKYGLSGPSKRATHRRPCRTSGAAAFWRSHKSCSGPTRHSAAGMWPCRQCAAPTCRRANNYHLRKQARQLQSSLILLSKYLWIAKILMEVFAIQNAKKKMFTTIRRDMKNIVISHCKLWKHNTKIVRDNKLNIAFCFLGVRHCKTANTVGHAYFATCSFHKSGTELWVSLWPLEITMKISYICLRSCLHHCYIFSKNITKSYTKNASS